MKSLIFCFLSFLLIFQSVQSQSDPFVFVIFGGTGDLTARKLIPALYNLSLEEHIQNHAVVGIGRKQIDHVQYRKNMKEAVDRHSRNKEDKSWEEFEKRIFYHAADVKDDNGYIELKKELEKIDREWGTRGNRIFFLAVHPSFFQPIIEKLHAHQLIHQPANQGQPWSRVIIEKPFGSDLNSAMELQKHLVKFLHESQIYRMDHYLGKEGVQNLISFRFENGLFEPLWNNRLIEQVQITLGEEIGIGSRASFWEETGALRDILQNHLMQLLALVAMEPPIDLQPASLQKEKLKVLHAIRHFPIDSMDHHVVRGQYAEGEVKGAAVSGYRDEEGVPPTSSVETYVAAKLFIDNPRWEGVPFYIRGGKRLNKQGTEIIVVFKNQSILKEQEKNMLLIRIQPHAGIFLKTASKVPGMKKELQPVLFGFKPDAVFNTSSPEAYEKLIFDCIRGDDSHYVNGEEQLASWRLLTPVLHHWNRTERIGFYPSGTRGPIEADHLLEKEGHHWIVIE